MRKSRAFLTVCAALLAGMAVCAAFGKRGGETEVRAEDGEVSIVCTTFPSYDWAQEIIGEERGGFHLEFLLDNGTDSHNFQPAAEDIAKISACDIFVYVGGESDKWAQDALREGINPDMQVLSMMEILKDSIKEEEPVMGEGEAHEEEHEHGYDEHVWLSLRNAQSVVEAMTEAIKKADPSREKIYEANKEAYREKLEKLDGEYQAAVDAFAGKTILVGDRFPFRYLTEDYGLSYYAAFEGCSAETEASFETVTFLAKKLDEEKLPAILVLENSDRRIAETIRQNTKEQNQEILTLNSLQSVTQEQVDEGITYLGVMEDNLEILGGSLCHILPAES